MPRSARLRVAIITASCLMPPRSTTRWPTRCSPSFASTRADMSEPSYIGRLAPSPTGAQHVGNARTYLIAWLAARSCGGQVFLRIEDIDSPRVKPGAAEQACYDLRWLGLDWDEGPIVQTQRLPLYEEALRQLQAKELVYPCTCTRKDVEQAASAP